MKRKEQCIGMSTVELHSNLSRLFTWRGTWFFEQELGFDYNRDFEREDIPLSSQQSRPLDTMSSHFTLS